jgi:uncharacterized protein (TIGR00369 family)
VSEQAEQAELLALIEAARSGGDLGALSAAVPAARFLGLVAERAGDELRMRLDFAPHLVGNSLIPALHGGVIGALLESTAIFSLMLEGDATGVPRTINVTVEYLRTARTVTTWARAEITKQGRRVATVRAFAWQDDPDRPVAAANAHFLLPREA